MSRNNLNNMEDNQDLSFDAAPEPQVLNSTIQQLQHNLQRFPDADDDPSLQHPIQNGPSKPPKLMTDQKLSESGRLRFKSNDARYNQDSDSEVKN